MSARVVPQLAGLSPPAGLPLVGLPRAATVVRGVVRRMANAPPRVAQHTAGWRAAVEDAGVECEAVEVLRTAPRAVVLRTA